MSTHVWQDYRHDHFMVLNYQYQQALSLSLQTELYNNKAVGDKLMRYNVEKKMTEFPETRNPSRRALPFTLAPSLSLFSLSLPRDALSLLAVALSLLAVALSLLAVALSLLAVARSLSPRRRRVVVVVTGSQSPLPCLLFPDPDPDLG
ncbi:hypothetical protein DY000_02004724 [Brassica cretica]|uniref:Uncharacterized protein n=1 Tax=Brassica cretica TaxID=69181 RepID=A0ABQ7C356_BRACR|nr:hypothetical protein DY000_02004724 [Brassica cretica]